MPHERRSPTRRPADNTYYRMTVTAALALTWATTQSYMLGTSATPGPVPAPACDVPPRTPEEISVLLGESGIATPAATTGGQTLPEGVPADAETTVAIERIIRLWLACQNAGEPLRAWSLFSDGYLYRLLSRQGVLSEGAFREEGTSYARAAEASTVPEIAGQRLLPDGRYGATVVIAYPSVPMPKRFFFYFTWVDGRLLIDGILGEISFSIP